MIPFEWKPDTAEKFWNNRATLFVALAIAGGNPKKTISIGNVMREPPPAMTFRDPATKPITIIMIYS